MSPDLESSERSNLIDLKMRATSRMLQWVCLYRTNAKRMHRRSQRSRKTNQCPYAHLALSKARRSLNPSTRGDWYETNASRSSIHLSTQLITVVSSSFCFAAMFPKCPDQFVTRFHAANKQARSCAVEQRKMSHERTRARMSLER